MRQASTKISLSFASAVFGIFSEPTLAQSPSHLGADLARAAGGNRLGLALDSLGGFQSGVSMGNALSEGQTSQATAMLVEQAVGGAIRAPIIDGLIGSGLGQLVMLGMEAYAIHQSIPDGRLRVERLREELDIEYYEVPYQPQAYGGRSETLNFEISLRQLVQERLIARADEQGTGGFLPDTILDEEINSLRIELAEINTNTIEPPTQGEESTNGTGFASNMTGGNVSSCILTEGELFNFFLETGGGVGFANDQVIAISQMATTEVIGRDPFTYRVYDQTICSSIGGQAGESIPALSQAAVQTVLNGLIQEECGGPGTFDLANIPSADFDGDGNLDFAADPWRISCANGRTPGSCGTQVCFSRVYFMRNGSYVEVFGMQNSVGSVVDGNPPGLNVSSHGGGSGTIYWNGQAFAPRH